ncbi:hypothetical protein Fmac_014613 [Flemingia macrophylla]|uniref:Protein kinase domain-containing protein n=1 Tax=Flemingia macrophylla TaxID=520843 RepID=A0ABD1MC81_9FABA
MEAILLSKPTPVKMDDEHFGSIDITDDAIISYSGRVESLIRSETASFFGESRLPSFASRVDRAIRSRTPSNFGTSPVHSVSSTEDNERRSGGTSGADLGTLFPVNGFAAAVDKKTITAGLSLVESLIRSETASFFGESRLPSFASRVDRAIRSRTPSNFGTSPVHSVSSTEDNERRPGGTSGADLGTLFPVNGFAAALDKNTITAGLSLVETGATRHDFEVEGIQLFTLAELVEATNNFSRNKKIGAGSFAVVYRAKLVSGREVAVKRGQTWPKRKSEVMSELAFLSRLHHKNLVGIVGFCEEKDERLLVCEYMKNGTLYDHLHGKGSSVLNSWKMRVKIALDASRGIQYLHDYVVPSIIHKDVKSSNILLDATWTAKVSDFGLSLMSPEPDQRPMNRAGTVGYIDPEYYGLNVLTTKSDVYGLGVVLLELLTGKRPIFLYGEDGGTLLSVHRLVDFAVPAILGGDLVKILDPRVGPLDVNEVEAVELVAHTALQCVNLKGKERPTMTDIVVVLQRALAICDSSIYSGTSYDVSVRKAVMQHCMTVGAIQL